MNDLVLSPIPISDLETLIDNAVTRAIRREQKQPQQPVYDGMNPTEAINFLNENGYPVKSRATLYGKVFKNEIPHSKVGKRLVFSRKALQAWLTENRVPTASERLEEAEKFISEHKKTR